MTITKKKQVKKKSTKKKPPEPPPAPMESRALPPLPPVPVLQRALVLWSTGNGSQKDLAAAETARLLCTDNCFFCGKEGPNPSMAAKTPWTEVEICGCLPAEDTYTNPDWRSAPAPGYSELLPSWQERQTELAEKANSGQLDRRRPVYSNVCVKCGEKFMIPVAVVAASVTKYGSHAVMNRCRPCKDAAKKGVRPQNKSGGTAQEESAA